MAGAITTPYQAAVRAGIEEGDLAIVVGLGGVEELAQRDGGGPVDGVARLGAIQRQQLDVSASLAQYFVGHGVSFERPRRAPEETLVELGRAPRAKLTG